MKDLAWLRPDGAEITPDEWRDASLRSFGVRLCGEAMDERDERGEPVTDDTLFLAFNADARDIEFVLPDPYPGTQWRLVFDTRDGDDGDVRVLGAGATIKAMGRSVVLLRGDRRTSDGHVTSGETR